MASAQTHLILVRIFCALASVLGVVLLTALLVAVNYQAVSQVAPSVRYPGDHGSAGAWSNVALAQSRPARSRHARPNSGRHHFSRAPLVSTGAKQVEAITHIGRRLGKVRGNVAPSALQAEGGAEMADGAAPFEAKKVRAVASHIREGAAGKSSAEGLAAQSLYAMADGVATLDAEEAHAIARQIREAEATPAVVQQKHRAHEADTDEDSEVPGFLLSLRQRPAEAQREEDSGGYFGGEDSLRAGPARAREHFAWTTTSIRFDVFEKQSLLSLSAARLTFVFFFGMFVTLTGLNTYEKAQRRR